MVNTIDLGIRRVDNPDGSWTYYDKEGRQVGCGFSTVGLESFDSGEKVFRGCDPGTVAYDQDGNLLQIGDRFTSVRLVPVSNPGHAT